MKQAVMEYWQSRNARERLILASVASLALLAILYAYAWMPIAEERAQLRKTLPELQANAAQFGARAEEVERLSTQTAARGTMNVMSVIEGTAKMHNLRDKFSALSAIDANHVRVVSASIAFDAWLTLTRDLQAQGIRADSVQINSLQEGPGLVKLNATFSGPGK